MKKYTPENITKKDLGPNEIFCFGSNKKGIHGAGAARFAFLELGAKMGVGEGLTGRCYALPTKDENIETLSLEEIRNHIQTYNECVKATPAFTYLTTKIGSGLAGIPVEDIAKLFQSFDWPSNVIFPKEFNIDNFDNQK